jgi:hypothetical protein
MTPWHPELGRKRATGLLVFYLVLCGPVLLFFLGWSLRGGHRF